MKNILVSGITIAALFSGCATTTNSIVPNPDRVANKALKKEQYEPAIRDYDENHYKMDAFFAMPNAHTQEEAEQQYKELLEAAKPIYHKIVMNNSKYVSRFAKKTRKFYPNGVVYYYRSLGGMTLGHYRVDIIKSKDNVYFTYSYRLDTVNCANSRGNECGLNAYQVRKYKEYTNYNFDPTQDTAITLKPIKIGNEFYLVVYDTNVIKRSIGDKFLAFLGSGGNTKVLQSVLNSNSNLSRIMNLSFFEAIKKNPKLKENFVNIQTGDDSRNLKDDRAELYRQKYLAGLM